jgi:hypothetical protein
MGGRSNFYKISVGILGVDLLKYLGVGGSIMLKWI